MTAASLSAVGELVRDGAVEKLNIGANDLQELGSPDQCVQMRTGEDVDSVNLEMGR